MLRLRDRRERNGVREKKTGTKGREKDGIFFSTLKNFPETVCIPILLFFFVEHRRTNTGDLSS